MRYKLTVRKEDALGSEIGTSRQAVNCINSDTSWPLISVAYIGMTKTHVVLWSTEVKNIDVSPQRTEWKKMCYLPYAMPVHGGSLLWFK